jgi:hypothetical protein
MGAAALDQGDPRPPLAAEPVAELGHQLQPGRAAPGHDDMVQSLFGHVPFTST